MGALSQSLLEWGWAGAALEGDASGDVHVVAEREDGVLLAVIDGLGHGVEAAAAAREAAGVLAEHAGEPLDLLLTRCHAALRGSRGAVMSVAAFDARERQLTWAGVGNVDAFLSRRDPGTPAEAIVLRGGIVGYHLPAIRPATIPVSPGDVLTMATDGIRGGFLERVTPHAPAAEIAEAILAGYARGTDDALVLVARVLAACAPAAPSGGGLG